MEVGKVQNELVRGDSGWSSFAEREVKDIVDWLLSIVYTIYKNKNRCPQ